MLHLNLQKQAQDIWKAYNSDNQLYENNSENIKPREVRVAWTAVKKEYHKGNWVKKIDII